jgi:hypothetical protein
MAPKLAAIATALRVMERRSNYLGLDKPTKIASTDHSGLSGAPPVAFYIPHNGRESVALPAPSASEAEVL